VDPKIFDEALKDYFDNKQEQAARKLYAFVESTPPTDENYSWAQYFLARCLIDLSLRHGGAVYLAKVAHERSNPQVLPKTLEALKVLTQVPHDEVLIDEQIFGSLDLGFLPDSVSDYANYQQGIVDLRVGNERWAKTHFVKLEEDGVEASRAKFALLVTRLRNAKQVDDQVIDDFLELSKDQKLTLEARNEARLAVARLRYEKKDYEGALKAYDMVQLPSLDPGRATLYLEEAWTRYNLGQLRATIGLLTTLDAPSFRDEFLPDKYILRALVYRDLCQYLPAKRAAKELTRRFSDSLEAIREREDLTQDFRLRRAANSHGSTKRAARFLDSLNLETEQLNRHAGGFGDRLYKHLQKVYDLAHAESERIYQQRLRDAVREEADKLAPRRRAGAAHGVRGRPQALRAREARRQAGPAGEGDPADLGAARLQVHRRVLERRAPQLPGEHPQPLHRGGSPVTGPLLLLLLAQAKSPLLPTLDKSVNPVVTKQREKTEYLEKLKRDIFKVDRSLLETERLIAKSRNAPYLPDLQFRLAELYVEKSRYVYFLQVEQRGGDNKGAIVSPETKLLKQKAVQLYNRLLREFPDFHDADKVTFYLAHEMRELGQFDELLKTLNELIAKYPKSPLRLESEQIIGDYYFDKTDLAEAEKHYQEILKFPQSPVHDLARYKLGWIRVNQTKFNDAVTFFEGAAGSEPIAGVDSQKALNVKREALLDLVYSYTEARPAKARSPTSRSSPTAGPPTPSPWTSWGTATSSSSSTSGPSPRCAS
jgi:TolA-binding protein